jgi:predicted RecB family nuclease
MPITEEIVDAVLKCEMKAHLKLNSPPHISSEISHWERSLRESYRKECNKRLRSMFQWHPGSPDLQSLRNCDHELILDYRVALPEINARIDALVLRRRASTRMGCPYIPIRFVPSERVSMFEKLLLAFDAIAVSKVFGKMPRLGRIIHGRDYRAAAVPLLGLIRKVTNVLRVLSEQQAENASPPLALNKYCSECEFHSRCREIAVAKDDLSLLATLSPKQRKKQKDKGIFTVLQLSYTFRSPRHSARPLSKHHPALKALAIRKNQIHVFGTPAFSLPQTPVYIDVEGNPDRDFYYLIGLRIPSESQPLRCSYWADTEEDEREIWASCLRTLSELDTPRLIHYGAYETQFLKRMRARYPEVGSASQVDELISSAQNLLSVIYPHIYFPTYTNGLKDVATYLGYRWSGGSSSGLNALGWRLQWEASGEAGLKDRLIVYNADDCEASEKVADALAAICCPELGLQANYSTVKADALKREFPQRFGDVNFVLPEFRKINRAAYWDYQRSKVYVRSNCWLRGQKRKSANRQSMSKVPVNKLVVVNEERPTACPRCNSYLIYRIGRTSQTVYDLRFSPAGLKRWVVRYSHRRFICWKCKATFRMHEHRHKYGACLCAYLLYQIIELQLPQNAVAKSVNELFKLPLSRGSINRLKAREAARLEPAYKCILERIVQGALVHADETKVTLAGQDGYVWVFTNMEDVAFVYSESRDAGTPQSILSNFNGVLISDFYAAYDSMACTQQKCLVHLMRDLNEDLSKQPFNDEMRVLAQNFANLLKPMIETVDRFGLKAYHLRPHKDSVKRFYEALAERDYQTDVAIGYKRRFERNSGKLFTFLDHDGIPWNNNNAEHAIKAFARLRRSIDGKSSQKGIRDYLVLLSVSETCKYRGMSFLNFLKSGRSDISANDEVRDD